MAASVHDVLAAFDALDARNRQQVTAQILSRSVGAKGIGDEILNDMAAEVCHCYDTEEGSHADSDDSLIRVQARVEDAGVLGENKRYEGALLMLLIAVAARSRKRYPVGTPSRKDASKRMSDREAFTTFLRDEIWRLVKEHSDFVVFRGKPQPIEEFLYKFLRCELVHQGGTPVNLYPMHDSAVLTIDYPDGSGVSFTPFLLARLNDVVWRVRENSYEAVKPEMDAIARRRAAHPRPLPANTK